MNIQEIIQDPDYTGLPEGEKAKVINFVLQKDEDFAGLPAAEQGKVREHFIKGMYQQPKGATQKLAEWKYTGIETPAPKAIPPQSAMPQGKYTSIIKPIAEATEMPDPKLQGAEALQKGELPNKARVLYAATFDPSLDVPIPKNITDKEWEKGQQLRNAMWIGLAAGVAIPALKDGLPQLITTAKYKLNWKNKIIPTETLRDIAHRATTGRGELSKEEFAIWQRMQQEGAGQVLTGKQNMYEVVRRFGGNPKTVEETARKIVGVIPQQAGVTPAIKPPIPIGTQAIVPVTPKPITPTMPSPPVAPIAMPAVTTVPEAVTKEPWEMTQKEYLKHSKDLYEKTGSALFVDSAFNRYSSEARHEIHQKAQELAPNKYATQQHIQSILRAGEENKPVPAEVLKDYPELAKGEGVIEMHAGVPLTPPIDVSGVAANVEMGAKRFFDVEAPFKKVGAPETGRRLKLMQTTTGYHTEKGYGVIKDITRTGHDSGLVDADFQNVTRLLISQENINKLSSADKEKYKYTINKVRADLDNMKDLLIQKGSLEKGFAERVTAEAEEKIDEVNRLLEKKVDPARKKELEAQREEAQNTLNFMQDKGIQYVPINRAWIESFVESNPEATRKMSQYWSKRKTVDMEGFMNELLEQGVITPEQTDIRRITADYHRQVGRKVAMADLINAAKAEGMLMPATSAPSNYVGLPTKIKGLAEYKAHPELANYFQRNMLSKGSEPVASRLLSYYKGMFFYNPLFLAAYDTMQGTWLGSMRNVKAPMYMVKGGKSAVKKDDEYWKAFEHGAFSQPYTPNFEEHEKIVEKIIADDPTLIQILGKLKAKHGLEAMDGIMALSHDLAWLGDQSIRMASWHYLKAQNKWTDEEIGQLVAQAHADYASVPAKTRQMLNLAFFTPTFQIAMWKAQWEYAKAFGHVIFGRKTDQMNQQLAKAFMGLVAGVIARKYIMKWMGYEEQDFGVRYYKVITDPETGQDRELVVYVPTPDNIMLRYWSRIRRIPDTDDTWQKMMNAAPFSIHPFHRWYIQLLSNKDIDGTPIRNKFDDPVKQGTDALLYSIRSLYRITETFIPSQAAEGKEKAVQMLAQDFGKFAQVLRHFVIPYLRSTQDRRDAYKVLNLISDFKQVERKRPSKTDEEADSRVENLRNKIKEIQEKSKPVEQIGLIGLGKEKIQKKLQQTQ